MALGLSALRFQQVIAHIGAGDVDVAADPLQQTGPCEEVFADRIVGSLDTVQGLNAVEPGEAHEQQEAAKSRQQYDASCHLSGPAHLWIASFYYFKDG